MAGPTSVSALIHSSTLITAGVFLLIKFSIFFQVSKITNFFIIFFSLLTLFFISITGCFQNDLKKIIAFSTSSQLGWIFIICGFLNYKEGLYHILTHGFTKSSIFLICGLVIHVVYIEQDIRKMGGLVIISQKNYLFICISLLSLIGIPFLSLFYSKELILESILISNFKYSLISFHFITISIILTSWYSIKLWFFIFYKKPNNSKPIYIFQEYLYKKSYIVIFFLILLCIFSGFFLKEFFSINSNFCIFFDTFFNFSAHYTKNFYIFNNFLLCNDFKNINSEFLIYYPIKYLIWIYIFFVMSCI